jgi:hypothetical protein
MNAPTIKDPLLRLDPSWQQALKTPLVMALGAALVLQLLLALFANSGRSLAPAAADTPLLAVDPATVTAIDIANGDGSQTTRLTRGDEGWVLSDLAGFPADSPRIDQLLQDLSQLKRPLPVATSEAAQKRFKVADDGFERRLTLHGQKGDIATLLVGESPGFRRVFARLKGEPAVYDVRLALFDLSASSDDWIDHTRLRLDRAGIKRISGGDWALVHGDNSWSLDGSDQHVDTQAVDDLLSRLAGLSYRGVLGTEDRPEHNLDKPVLALDIDLANGDKRSYRIAKIKDSEDYVLKEASSPYFYRLAAFDLDGLLDLSKDKLLGIKEPPKQQAKAEAATPEAATTRPTAESPAPAGAPAGAASTAVEQPASGPTSPATNAPPASTEQAPEATPAAGLLPAAKDSGGQ